MAETAAQKRSRVMKERIQQAKARSTSGGEDAAAAKVVAPPTPTKKPTAPTKELSGSDLAPNHASQSYWNKNKPKPDEPGRPIVVKKQSSGTDSKTYQKHVLFALVLAFCIQLLDAVKALPQFVKKSN